MSASVNQVNIVGTMVRDPEIRAVGDTNVTNFTLAVNRIGRKDKEGKDITDWIRVSAWDNKGYTLAQTCHNLLKKGMSVYISGRLEIGSYEKDGQKRETHQIIARDMQILSSKKSDNGEASGNTHTKISSNTDNTDSSQDDTSIDEEIPF